MTTQSEPAAGASRHLPAAAPVAATRRGAAASRAAPVTMRRRCRDQRSAGEAGAARAARRSTAAATRYTATGKVVEAPPACSRTTRSRSGDHIDAIARDLDTTREVLLDANHSRTPYDLRPGQI